MKFSLKNSKNLYLYEKFVGYISAFTASSDDQNHSHLFSSQNAMPFSSLYSPTHCSFAFAHFWREELQRTSLRHQISRANVISVILLIFCALVQVL